MNEVTLHIRSADIRCTEYRSDCWNQLLIALIVNYLTPSHVCTCHERATICLEFESIQLSSTLICIERKIYYTDRIAPIVEIFIELLLQSKRVELSVGNNLDIISIKASETLWVGRTLYRIEVGLSYLCTI